MPKAEISWKRVTEDGVKLQVYAQRVRREWKFFQREKRFDQWQPVPEPPLEDWLELLDAVQRLITRRRYQPERRGTPAPTGSANDFPKRKFDSCPKITGIKPKKPKTQRNIKDPLPVTGR